VIASKVPGHTLNLDLRLRWQTGSLHGLSSSRCLFTDSGRNPRGRS
jgi:hypothetical protein